MDDLPANIITATRGRYTAKTIPDISKTFKQTRPDLVCDICGEDEMSGFDIIDHWVDAHDINIHEKEISARVKDWNKALEKYEDRNDLSNETEFITDPYTYSPKEEPTATAPGSATHGDLLQIGREIEEKLNSFKTELLGRIENGPMREASDSIKRPVSYTHLTLPTICSV